VSPRLLAHYVTTLVSRSFGSYDHVLIPP
jgi:hypothetical protein